MKRTKSLLLIHPFIMSDIDLTTKPSPQTINSQPNYNIQDISYQFTNSNIIKQKPNQSMTLKVQQAKLIFHKRHSKPIYQYQSTLTLTLFGSY